MPNHISNWVHIKGSKAAIKKLKADTIKQGEEDTVEFDFNGISPMPEELKNTVTPTQVVQTQAEANKINKDRGKLPYADGKVVAITEKEANRRKKLYGSKKYSFGEHDGILNWYDYANEYWGTKWGAYEASIVAETETSLTLFFNTAWAPPTPIFDKLAERGLEVHCFWQDEDPSNYGDYGDPYDYFDIDLTARVEFLGGN
jgi:hypothetical protein